MGGGRGIALGSHKIILFNSLGLVHQMNGRVYTAYFQFNTRSGEEVGMTEIDNKKAL